MYVLFVVIGYDIAYNDLRFILAQAIMPYVQSGISRMYCLSRGARMSWRVTNFRAEIVRFESLWSLSVLDGEPYRL
jgi:hypothetical protein